MDHLGRRAARLGLDPSNAADLIKLIRHSLSFKVIHISTDHFYNKINSAENEVNLLNVYSQTKYFGEFLFDPKIDLILRTNFYGLDLSENLNGFVEQILLKYKRSEIITAFNDVFFNPLYVGDLVKILSSLSKSNISGIYNVGSTDYVSKEEFIRKIFETFSLNDKNLQSWKLESVNLIAKRPQFMVGKVNKFISESKFSLPSTEETFKNFVKNSQNNISRRLYDEI